MYDLACVGTTTVDMYFKGEALTHNTLQFNLGIGQKYFTDYFYEGIGGGATNVAIGVSKLGLRSTLISEIGQNPFKRVIIEKLDLTNVAHSHCLLTHDYYNFSTVLLTENGEKTVINYRTHKTKFLHDLPEDTIFRGLKGLYLGNLSHISVTKRANLLTHAKKHDIATFVTLGTSDCQKGFEQNEEILRHTDVLILNSEEFANLVQISQNHLNWSKSLLTQFTSINLPKIVIITDGSNGSYGYWQSNIHHQPAEKISRVVDSTGAGDGYAAGFIAGCIKSNQGNIPAAMAIGTRYASLKLRHLGAN